MTIDPTKLEELRQQAASIAHKGEADTVIALLAKGMTDAIGTMSALLLRKSKDADADDEDGDPDPDPDEAEGKDAEGGDGAGYTDMRMGVPRQPVQPTQPGTVDVTDVLLQLPHQWARLSQENAALRKAVKRQDKQIQELTELVKASALANLQTSAPLVKAVSELQESLTGLPNLGPATRQTAPRVKRISPENAGHIGGTEETEKRALLKARREGIVSAFAMRLFNQSRQFDEDPTEHNRIRSQVESLAR